MTLRALGPIISLMSNAPTTTKATTNATAWKLERAIRRTPSEVTFHLGDGRLSGMACALRIERRDEGRFLVRATFANSRDAYARAEAARFYAQMLDTMGDLEGDADDVVDGLAIDDDISLLGAAVELAGTDAAIAAISFFGGDFGAGNAADAITDALI